MDLHSLALSVARLTLWLLLLSIVFLPLEAAFSVRRRRAIGGSIASDAGFYFLSGIVASLLLIPPMALVGSVAGALVPARFYAAVAALPLPVRAAGALFISEFGFYWGHRWAHAIPLLWRFHAIHHAPEELYFLLSSRAHPLDNVFVRLCGLIPVSVLGLATPLTPDGGAVAALLVIAFTFWGFFIHSNLRLRLGPIEWLVATPHFHHWHHALEPRDKNFASTLPIFDRLFGTHHAPATWPEHYGIEAKLPPTLGGQLVHPFVPQPTEPAPVRA